MRPGSRPWDRGSTPLASTTLSTGYARQLTCSDGFMTQSRVMNPTNEAVEPPQVSQPKASRVFPIIVKSGGISVRIHRTPATVRGTKCLAFTVDWTSGRARKRKVFRTSAGRRSTPKQSLTKRSEGKSPLPRSQPRTAFALRMPFVSFPPRLALDRVDSPGLLEIVRDYAATTKLLPRARTCVNRSSTTPRATHPMRPTRPLQPSWPNGSTTRATGCSEAHLADLKKRLGRFGTTFQMPIGHDRLAQFGEVTSVR